MGDWVYDSVIGFLQSPVWAYPVNTFIDENCVVFDPGEENKFSYTDIHNSYQQLVEHLLAGFMSDIGMSSDQFVQAWEQCATTSSNLEKHLIEQIVAADDFLMFKSMMVERNIQLERQALELLEQRPPHTSKGDTMKTMPPFTTSEQEEKLLEEVLEQSRQEYELQCSLDEEEMERMMAIAKEESLKMYQSQQELAGKVEENLRVVAEEEGATEPQDSTPSQDKVAMAGESSSPSKAPETGQPHSTTKPAPTTSLSYPSTQSPASSLPPLPKKSPAPILPSPPVQSPNQQSVSGAEAAARWVESARAELKLTPTHEAPEHTTAPEDYKSREAYLKRQRDHLLQMKKQQRAQEFDSYTSSLSPSQPQSAMQAAQMAASGSLAGRTNTAQPQQSSSKKKPLTKGASGSTGVLCTAIASKLKKNA